MQIDLSNIRFDSKHIEKHYDPSFVTRYTIVCKIVEEIKRKTKKRSLHILDLGGYNGASRQLLPDDRVTILDITSDGSLEDYIQVSSVTVPCEDNTFDVVISTDTLEHIEGKERRHFLDEALRVAKLGVVLAAPFEIDGSVGREERLSDAVYVGETGERYRWLAEHHDFKLPDRQETDRYFQDKKVAFTRFSHTSIRIWGDLLRNGFFIANNLSAAEPRIGRSLERLNKLYFDKVAIGDFPQDGYRTIYVALKGEKEVVVALPQYDAKAAESFSELCNRTLGKAIALTSKTLYESEEHVKSLLVEIDRLRTIETQYQRLMRSRGQRLIHGVKRMIGRDQ